MYRFSLFFALLLVVGCNSTPAPVAPAKPTYLAEFDRFKPAPAVPTSMDYSQVNELLNAVVLSTGPSIRQRLGLPPRPTGTNKYYGHTSPLRMEGNKIQYSMFGPTMKQALSDYADNLELIANQQDITALPKAEQLAFWFNLHNLLVMDQIVKHYPVKSPTEIEPFNDGVALHDAKLITIKGVALSLRDIRTQIVYRYWQTPEVFYGFYHGDIASPNIRRQAYTGNTVFDAIKANAREFVNALRGVSNSFGPIEISPLYEEARPHLFSAWPDDFIAHTMRYADEPVADIMRDAKTLQFASREKHVNDLMGGEHEPTVAVRNVMGMPMNVSRANFLQEFANKQTIMLNRMDDIGTVTVKDLNEDEIKKAVKTDKE